MIDQAVDNFNQTISASSPGIEEFAIDIDTNVFDSFTGDKVLALVFCAVILACSFYMSHSYNVEEREAEAEANRMAMEAEQEKIQKMETKRSKIAQIIENYAVHLTNITSLSSVMSSSRHDVGILNASYNSCVGVNNKNKNRKTRTIPNGNEDEDADADFPVEMITIENSDSATQKTGDIEDSSNSSDDDDDDDDSKDQFNMGERVETSRMRIPSTLTIDNGDKTRDDDRPIDSSLSTNTSITLANLREAVTNNPCAICLEPFKAGDAVVCCSNTISGKKPHVFHQACSLDYIVTHTDGIHAPCPCCRKHLLPFQKPLKGCLKHSHSALTLPELGDN
jgi:hypothetical protein